jgi:hypothetical protein
MVSLAGNSCHQPLPPPSALQLGGEFFPAPPPAFVVRCVLGVRRFLLRLADLLCPAQLALFDHCTGLASTALLGVAARYGIADYLAQHGPSAAPAIARDLRLNADALHRMLRALSNMGIFAMSDEGRFSNNRLSLALRSGQLGRGREWALYFSSGSNARAWLDVAHTLETGESAFNHLHGMNVWQWFEAHEDEREIFAHCMMGLTVMDAPLIASLYPFEEVKRLCDVGGGRGALLSEIVMRHPHLRGVLHDSPGVVASAGQLFVDRGIRERVELSAGNFFEAVPAGCDAYLMKNILHDWDDATCERLLRVVRSAAQPGARMLLCESLVEKNSRELIGTRADLQMMIACENGRERSLGEFQRLLAQTGFRYRRVFSFPTLSVIEAEAA